MNKAVQTTEADYGQFYVLNMASEAEVRSAVAGYDTTTAPNIRESEGANAGFGACLREGTLRHVRRGGAHRACGAAGPAGRARVLLGRL
jgi:hypothetical protein